MITLTLLIVILAIFAVITVISVIIGGFTFIVIFGDFIVAILILCWIIRHVFFRG